MLPIRAGVYAHRVTVLEAGERLERAEGYGHLRVSDAQPQRLSIEETRMPWAWLRIDAGPHRGEKHRVESDLMGMVRVGDELIVVSEDGTGRPLLIEKLTTGQSFEDDEPHPLRSDGTPAAWVRMIGCFAFLGAVLLTIPLLIPWLWVSTQVSEALGGPVGDDRFGLLVILTPVAAALVTAFASHLYDSWETRRRAVRWSAIMRSRDALAGEANAFGPSETKAVASPIERAPTLSEKTT